MPTKAYNIHKDFHETGGCQLSIYDSKTADWIRGPMVADVTWEATREVLTKEINVKGMRQQVDSRTKAKGGTVSFRMMETLSPYVQHLLYGDSTTAQTFTNSEAVTISTERFPQVIDTEEYYLRHEYGLAQADSLTACTFSTPVKATGGTIAAGDYYVWVASGYGTIPTNSAGVPSATAMNDTDKTFIFHTPTASTGAIATSGTDLALTFTATEGTGAPAGDFWIVFISETNSLATATAAHVVARSSAAQAITVTAAGADTYEACNYVYVQEVATYGDTPTYTERTITTDFTCDLDQGVFKRVSGGSLTSGSSVQVITWVIEPANVATDIGANANNADYRIIMFSRFDQDGSDPDVEDRRQQGKEYVFERVNFSEMAGGVRFNEEDWDSGETVSMTTLLNSSTGRIGYSTVYSPKHTGATQQVYD